jgi:hypothetical protein
MQLRGIWDHRWLADVDLPDAAAAATALNVQLQTKEQLEEVLSNLELV